MHFNLFARVQSLTSSLLIMERKKEHKTDEETFGYSSKFLLKFKFIQKIYKIFGVTNSENHRFDQRKT